MESALYTKETYRNTKGLRHATVGHWPKTVNRSTKGGGGGSLPRTNLSCSGTRGANCGLCFTMDIRMTNPQTVSTKSARVSFKGVRLGNVVLISNEHLPMVYHDPVLKVHDVASRTNTT